MEIIAVCSDEPMEHVVTLCGQNKQFLTAERCGMYNYHSAIRLKKRNNFTA